MSLPADRQGITILGTPLGTDSFVQRALHSKRGEHDRLLQRIPTVPDLQVAWLLLLHCASPRPNYLMRVLPPSQTEAFAREHDAAVMQCMGTLLANNHPAQLGPSQAARAHLPMSWGGMGLRSAERVRYAA